MEGSFNFVQLLSFVWIFFFFHYDVLGELPEAEACAEGHGVGSSFSFAQVGNLYPRGLWCQGRRSRGTLSTHLSQLLWASLPAFS